MYRGLARIFTAASLALVLAGLCVPLHGSSTWELGDLFVSVGNGNFQVRSNAAALKETLSVGTVGDVTGGCGLDASLNAYLVNTTQSTITRRALASPAHSATTISTAPDLNPQAIVFAANGDFYVGHLGGVIQRYVVNQSTGVAAKAESTVVPTDSTDSFGLDMAADQRTLFYTSGGRTIRRVTVDINSSNVATFGVASIFTTLPSPNSNAARALRLLPPGAGAGNDAIIGGVLVADKGNVKRVDAAGGVIQQYDAGTSSQDEDDWFALALDITDVDEAGGDRAFWAGDKSSGNLWRFNVQTGAASGPFSTGAAGSLRGLCLNGEPTTGQYSLLLKFDPATSGTILQTAVFAAGTPALEEHSFGVVLDFSQVPVGGLKAVVNAREAISNGVCASGLPGDTSDVDCGFLTHFSGDAQSPKAAAYAHARGVYYHVRWLSGNPEVVVRISSEGSLNAVLEAAGTCTAAPGNPPRALRILRDLSSTPEDQFAEDLTDSFFIDEWGTSSIRTNRFIIAARCATGSSQYIRPAELRTFKAGNSIPIDVKLTDVFGNPITNAITDPHRIVATVGTTGQVFFILGTPGSSPDFFKQVQPGIYSASLQTKGLPASTIPYTFCISDRIDPPTPSEDPLYDQKCFKFFLK